MKKLLLTLGAVAITASVSAANWQRSSTALSATDIQSLAGQEKTVVVKTSGKTTTGWFKPVITNETDGSGYFASCDPTNSEDTDIFSDEYVYTLKISDDGQSFTFKNCYNLYPPKPAAAHYNLVAAHKVENIDDAGYFTILNSISASSNVAGRYLLRSTAPNGHDFEDLHFSNGNGSQEGVYGPMYYATGQAGREDPWNANRTSAACLIYEVTEISGDPVEVTFNYPAFGGVQPNSATITLLPGKLNINEIPAVEYLTITGVSESNTTVSATNKTFTVTGTWDFPFALNRVYRTNIRKVAQRWTVLDNGQINTKSSEAASQFAPANLFYLKGHGYNSDNRLIVTLHAIGYSDNAGFNCSQNNNSQGTMESLEPTQWIVKLNSNSTATEKGISLQHPDAANAHANDISNKLGVWNASPSQNDGGSFIRFFDLTNSDFATTEYTYNGTSYTIDATDMATAQANPTSENVRALFPAEAIKQVRQVYVDMTYHGQSMLAGNFTGVVGKQYTFNAPPFFTDQVTVTIPATGDINFELQDPTLPFKHTATTDNMIWQAVHIHSSYADNQCYTWTYTEPNSKTMVEHKPANIGTEGYADNQLWAFVGNYLDGFKIYNKAAGTDKWLYGDDANVKVGTTEAKSIWKPYGNGVGLSHQAYCCLKADGTNYINLNVNAENGTTLTYWSGADQGSSCWFVAPAEPLLETAANFQFLGEGETYTGPRNAVGAILINGDLDLSYGPGVIAAAQANKYDLAAAEALRDLIAAYNSNVTVNQLEPNGFYRIQNILFDGQYLHTHETDGNIYSTAMSEADYRTNYHSIFKFEPVAGQTDRYYLLSQGHYVGHVSGTDGNHVSGPTQTTDEAERGEFSLVKISHEDPKDAQHIINTCAAFAIKDMTQSDYNFFHQGGNAGDGNYRITAWRQWAHGSHFYIVKADDIEIDLDQDFYDGYNNLHVGFGYFPFAVHATDNDTYFYTIHESYDKTTGEPVITYSDIDGYVPAHTPFMVSHRNSSTAILAIGEPTASTRNNVRRRALSATDDNVFSDGTTETDNWTGTNLANNSWTPVGSTNAPAQVVAVAAAHPTEVNINNLRIMDRQVTITTPGVLTVDMVYTSGSDRLVIAGVALLSNDKIVYGDFHRGFSGTQKIDKVYTINVEKSGTYTLRYYSTNGDNALSTNGTITLTFTAQNNANLLDGGLRETGVEAGDYVLGQTSQGLGFVKIDNAASIKGNYVYLPASKLSEESLVAASELPLVNRAETTDIQELSVKPAAAANAIYDLQGRRLGAPVKGFNIVNGRKVYVK